MPTLDQFLDRTYTAWLRTDRRNGDEECARLRANFGALLGGTPLDAIAPFSVEKWRTERRKAGISAGTLNRDVGALKALLSRAVAWRVIKANPLAAVKRQREAEGVVRYLSDDEEARLLSALSARDERKRNARESHNDWLAGRGLPPMPAFNEWFIDYLQPLVLVAMNTGLRRGELLALRLAGRGSRGRPADRSRQPGQDPGRTRHVPLNETAWATLVAWRPADAESPDTLVFGADVQDIKGSWGRLLKAAKDYAKFRFHDVRHPTSRAGWCRRAATSTLSAGCSGTAPR